jgi:L-histidine Nalpha-methyltransferase
MIEPRRQMRPSLSPELSQFATDVLHGLSAVPKRLSSKYFYDDEGSRLFQQIMALPEYYLTRCELEIFTLKADEIFAACAGKSSSLELIELGAGDGAKTAVLIERFTRLGADLSYSSVDISQQALDDLSARFSRRFPNLKIETHLGDYFEVLGKLPPADGERRRVVLFLGSNIGNFGRDASIGFFRRLRSVMNPGDLLLIGFDLEKDPAVILKAYDDSQGVTARFNLNLLNRINRELDADFDLRRFSHYAIYSPQESAARSFLISREKQSVRVGALERSFHFRPWEAIFMEISQKYSLAEIAALALESGYGVKQNFFDSQGYYCNSLWAVGRD